MKLDKKELLNKLDLIGELANKGTETPLEYDELKRIITLADSIKRDIELNTEIVIEVVGGVVQNVYGQYPADIDLLDFDNIQAEGDEKGLEFSEKKIERIAKSYHHLF